MRGFHTAALFAVVALALCAGGAADTSQARASNIITATAERPSGDGKASELPSAAKRRGTSFFSPRSSEAEPVSFPEKRKYRTDKKLFWKN